MADAPTRGRTTWVSSEPLPQPPPPQPRARLNAKEIITLEVRGQLFTDWTSVRVEQKVTEWFPTFVFECTEESPIPLRWDALQFVPGDVVSVYVGGVPALLGYISERHVGYDAKNHGVRLIGTGQTSDLTNSSVPLAALNGHDGQSWMQLAQDLSSHLGIKVKAVGKVDGKPFDNVQIQPGEVIAAALERYARMRNIVIGSDETGALLAIGENQAISTGELVEGGNILRANAVVRDPFVFKQIFAIGQGQGSDSANGDPVNKQVAMPPGSLTRNRHLVTVADISEPDAHGVQRRVMMEKVFTEGSYIEAQITVQGFFKDYNQSDSVWKAGEYYYVRSPSLILDELLGCSVCVYEQSDAGSTTTMTMVKPIHMNGQFNFRDGEQFVQQAARDLDLLVPSDL